MFWYLLLVLVFLCMVVCLWQTRLILKLSKQLKCDIKALPILGHAYLIGNKAKIMSGIQRFSREANKHGGLTYVWSFNIFGVVITDPETIDIVSKRCLEKYYIMKFIEPMLGNGSLIASVPMWRHRRKIILPTFRQPILNQFVNKIFSQQSVVMTERLREVEGKGTFPIWNYVNTYTLDSVFEAILGVQLKAQYHPDQPFIKAFEKCCALLEARICRPWLHSDVIYKLLPQFETYDKNAKVLKDFIDQIIKTKRQEMEINEKDNRQLSSFNNVATGTGNQEFNQGDLKPFLKLLLESADGERPITDLECREELLTLALAASDTSAVGASFTAVMLSRHPDVQEKAYQELRDVFGESDRLVEAEDLPRLTYLQAVIKETLRLYPPVPVVIRTIEKEILLPTGITLPKGLGVGFVIWGTHRNPRYWGEDADVFRPERFLNAPLKHPAAFIPFSFGPRNCPGHKYAMMSITTLTATLLRRYQLLPATPVAGNLIDQPLRLEFDIMMRDVDGFKVQIKSRV